MPTIEGPGAGAVSVQEAITGDRLFVHVDDSALRQLWTLVSIRTFHFPRFQHSTLNLFLPLRATPLQSFEPRDKEPEPNSSEGWW